MGSSFPKLSSLIQEHFESKNTKLSSGDLFVFINEGKNYLKILYYHNDGLCLFGKRLLKGHTFELPMKNTKLSLADLIKIIDTPHGPPRAELKRAA